MHIVQRYIREALRAGARKVLHRQGFRQPGGGWTLFREVGSVQQAISIAHTFRGTTGELWFPTRQDCGRVCLASVSPERRFFLDTVHGDPRDLSVELSDWFDRSLLPTLEPPPDAEAAARALEASAALTAWDLVRAASMWRAMKRPDEVERLRHLREALFPEERDAPF